MRLKKLGANARCPCGSGKKHKQCCATEHPWFESDEGHVVPQGVAREFDETYSVRDEAIRLAASEGLLSSLTSTSNSLDLFGLFTRENVVDLLAGLGFESEVLLYVERIGNLPPLDRWRCWLSTGEWVSNTPFSFEAQEAIARTLHEIIDCYAPRPRNPDGSACYFKCYDAIARHNGRYFGVNYEDIPQLREQGYDIRIDQP